MAVEPQAVQAGRCPTLQSSRPRARIRSLAAAHRGVGQTDATGDVRGARELDNTCDW
jgi:hypothetical protein